LRYNGGKIIGIYGKPGSGKDTIGNLMVREYDFRRLTIKKPIEDTVRIVFGIDESCLSDRDKREQPLPEWPGWTTRKLLQGVAQSLRDLVGEHLWAQSLCSRSCYDPKNSRIVVTDIRTPGDVSYIRQYVHAQGGKFILLGVKRPGFGSTTPGGFANHKLESYDLEPECDFVFINNGTIEQLYAQVRAYLGGICIHDLQYESDAKICEAINQAAGMSTPVPDKCQEGK
jgi:hypothetical protein